MPSFTVDVIVRCANCGEGLSGKTDIEDQGRVRISKVGPCPKCGHGEYRKGFEDGAKDKSMAKNLIESIMRYRGLVSCPACGSPDPDKHAKGCPVAALYPEE